MTDSWDEKLERLSVTRAHYHNDDYLEFLVDRVWKLHSPCRLGDFGCGFGYLGLKLLPLLREGSSYTGIDSSARLLEEARSIFADSRWKAEFAEADVTDVPFEDDTFDVTVSHSLLMHLAHPEKAVAEMARLTRSGGLVIACESNWNGHNALNHIAELDELEVKDLGFLQRLFARDSKSEGPDGNIGVKMPVLLHRAGLKNIGARMTDVVRCLLPPIDTEEKERLIDSLLADGFANSVDADREAEMLKRFAARGFSREEAESQIRRERFLADRFAEGGRDYHVVSPLLMTFSFGEVP